MERTIEEIVLLEAAIREATTPPNGQGSREISLALTNLQQARLWLQEHLRVKAQQGERPAVFNTSGFREQHG